MGHKLNFILPKAEPKAAATSGDLKVLEGPFEVTTAGGRKVVWALITDRFKDKRSGETVNFKGFQADGVGTKPLRTGASKRDIWEAVFGDATRRNI